MQTTLIGNRRPRHRRWPLTPLGTGLLVLLPMVALLLWR